VKKVAFVVQRCGLEVNGGAEAHCLKVARRMSAFWDAEVWTTCALDYMTWENRYPEGVEVIDGLKVRRFPVDKPRDVPAFNRLSSDVRARLPLVPLAEQEAWMRAQGPLSSGLREHLMARRDSHDAFFFFSYLYATTYFLLPLVREKAWLVPLAHDEWPVSMSMWDELFRMPRGLVFNTLEEKDFLRSRFPRASLDGPVAGVAVDPPEFCSAERFRTSHGIRGPFVLYLGRIDPAKGCDTLFRYFTETRLDGPSPRKLVLLGKPTMPVPDHPDIVHGGFVDEQAKWDALAACDLLIMPSVFESLSMVLLEAWSVGRPVLVNGDCDVLVGQCRRAHGGLWYRGPQELRAALLLMDERVRAVLGEQGRSFVRAAYAWPAIESHYRRAIGDEGSDDSPGAFQGDVMIETRIPEIDVDELMARVGEEARRGEALPAGGERSSSRDPEGPFPCTRPPSKAAAAHRDPWLSEKGYHLNDFLDRHDEEFVRFAYRAILGREPDAGGFDYYLDHLRRATMTKAEILGRLRYLAEGRARKAKVKGLLLPFLVQSSYRIPVVGYLSRLATGILQLPTILRNFQRLDAHVQHRFLETGQGLEGLARRMDEVGESSERKADRDELETLAVQKADWGAVEALLANKANWEDLEELADRKLDRSDLEALLSAKADREEFEEMGASKADRSHLEALASSKADREELEEMGASKADRIDNSGLEEVRVEVPEAFLPRAVALSAIPVESFGQCDPRDLYYYLFENVFCDPETVKKKQEIYLDLIDKDLAAAHPFLDAGCGRGEFLELLAARGIPHVGVDVNSLETQMLARNGFNVHTADIATFLRENDGKYSGISALQVVEHMEPHDLKEFLELCARRTVKNGVVILETVNPHSLHALSNFFQDETHKRPLPPEMLRFLVEWQGFKDVRVVYSGLLPERARIFSDQRMNYQDFAVVAYKR